jgi:hypothetical protein
MIEQQLREPRTGTNRSEPLETVLRGIVVACTLATAFIHASLGGILFTANAAGYLVLALALLAPLAAVRRVRWLVRLALLGFTATTVVGWLFMGARFPLAYLDKAIELALMTLLAADLWLADGGPKVIGRRILGEIASRLPVRAGPHMTARNQTSPIAPDDHIPERRKVA